MFIGSNPISPIVGVAELVDARGSKLRLLYKGVGSSPITTIARNLMVRIFV